MSDMAINQMLLQMRSMQALAESKPSLEGGADATNVDFSQLLKNLVNEVNQTQKTAGNLATSFELGDPSVNLSEVMVALQKANVSFQAMTQVRNNLVSAYKEIMSMQV